MDKNRLPKFTDKIYKEIENFEMYERTQCIAYEMAVRNPLYLEQVTDVINFYSLHKKKINFYIKNHQNFKKLAELRKCRDKFSFLIKMIEDIAVIPFNYRDKTLTFTDERAFGKKIYEIINLILKSYISNKDESNQSCVIEKLNHSKINIIENIKEEGFIATTTLTVDERNSFIPVGCYYGALKKDTGKFFRSPETLNEFKRHVIENRRRKDTIIASKTIEENFKRPKIKFNDMFSSRTSLTIDISKPLEEIEAYISHIKNKLQYQAPLEILGYELVTSNIKFSRKELAKQFFVYDYITARIIINKKSNHEFQEEYQKELNNILENDTISEKYKLIQKNSLKKSLSENLLKTNFNDLFYDEDSIKACALTSGTIKNYYYKIMPFIGKEKYKELITRKK